MCIGLDSNQAGSRTLEKSSRRDRDRVCAKFESSRRFRGSNMNPKKKSRRCLGLCLDSGLDLAISRFIYSLDHILQAPENNIRVISIFFQKFAEIFASQGALPVSMKPAASFATCTAAVIDNSGICHQCQQHRWQIIRTISNCLHLK